jgi:hypothetical protein
LLTISQVKNELFDEYRAYLVEHQDKIVDILILEGKKTLGDQVQAATLSFQSFLYTDNYFLTTLDLWLLVSKYKIPTIFISQKWILQTKYEKHEFVGYGDMGDKFTFIVIPALRTEIVPGYKLIQTNTGDTEISLDKLNDDCVERIREAINTKVSVASYLKSFKKPSAAVYKKKTAFAIEADLPEKKPKIIVEEETVASISPEEVFALPKKKRTRRKIAVVRTANNRTAKAKRPLVIASSSDKSEN